MILPKPLMPVGSKPVLELLLKWLRRNGIRQVIITTGYLGHLIRSVCGDGRQWDLSLKYTAEPEPLGTLGALTLLREELDSTFLVVNGDVLTDLNLNTFAAFHRKADTLVTVATARRRIKMDFGIIEETDGFVTHFKEKPTLTHSVSMGRGSGSTSAVSKIFTKRRSLLGMNSPRRSKRSPSLLKWLG